MAITRAIIGKFVDLEFDREYGIYVTVPKEGFIVVKPTVERFIDRDNNEIMEFEKVSYCPLDETGAFHADLIVPDQEGIEPNDWGYAITFSWNKEKLFIAPVEGLTPFNISQTYMTPKH